MAPNLEFTIDEFKVMHDAQFFINKKQVSDKIVSNFSLLNTKIETLKTNLLSDINARLFKQGKINRGENYELMPYFILDNPGVFNGKDVFAVRVMFWWGNFYSCTLHISGIYLNLFSENQLNSIVQKINGCFFCNNQDQWQHHFRENNYQPVNGACQKILNHADKFGFFKIAFKRPLTDYENFEKEVIAFLTQVFLKMKFKNQ
jgi:hypothetical protein